MTEYVSHCPGCGHRRPVRWCPDVIHPTRFGRKPGAWLCEPCRERRKQ